MKSLEIFKNEQLINLNENDNGEVVVSGRELHEFLGIGTQYTKWFERMKEYGFIESSDYLLVSQICLTNNPKNPTTTIQDHAMKLDMAKEIAMIQRNEKGKEHKHVLETLRNLVVGNSAVRSMVFENVFVNRGREYLLTRDGFSLLVDTSIKMGLRI